MHFSFAFTVFPIENVSDSMLIWFAQVILKFFCIHCCINRLYKLHIIWTHFICCCNIWAGWAIFTLYVCITHQNWRIPCIQCIHTECRHGRLIKLCCFSLFTNFGLIWNRSACLNAWICHKIILKMKNRIYTFRCCCFYHPCCGPCSGPYKSVLTQMMFRSITPAAEHPKQQRE